MVDKIIVAIAALAVLGLAAFFAVDRYVFAYGIDLSFKVLAVISAAVVIAGALAVLGARSNRGRK